MKLQTQYNKITIFSSILVLLIAGAGYYFLVHYILEQQLDDTLRVEEIEIHDFVLNNKRLPPATTYKDQKIEFKPIAHNGSRYFRTLTLFNERENENELSRQLVFPVEVAGQFYMATVTKSQEATEKIVGIILLITIGLIVLLGLLLFLANRFLVKRLWKPFRNTLISIRNFDLNAPQTIRPEKAVIDEFNELNENISLMTEKVVKDYLSLKHFTDQASHELQTPLAVINSKLDLLIQDPELSEKNLKDVQSIYDAVGKMSTLGQSLLLLTRIDNNQFNQREQVDILVIAENILNDFDEWIEQKNLTIIWEKEELRVTMNPQLAYTLITNLVLNCIKHSNENDAIVISFRRNAFSISNPGNGALPGNRIFDRFWKSEDSKGTGLGLAIVKEICDHHGFVVRYDFKDASHHFTIIF